MLRSIFLIGLLGILPTVGCSSAPSSAQRPATETVKTVSRRVEVPATDSPSPLAEPTQGGKAAKTKQVTIAVSGMT